MAVNRYTEYNPQQYVSNYVPLPLELMYKGLANKQKEFDDTMEQTYKMQDLMTKVNAIDKHKQYKKQLEDKYYPRIEEIADQITKTGDLSKARDIRKIAREWEHDPLRQELEASYANYQAYAADKIKKGDKYGEWYDNYLPFKGSDDAGNIAGYRYTGMGEVQDHQKRAHDMMDKIAADAAKSAGFKINPDGTIIKGGSGSEHVFSQKVLQLAKNKSKDFLFTTEGQDFALQLKYYNPNITDEQILNQATQYLYDAGSNQIFNKTESESDVAFTPWAKDIYDEKVNQEKEHWETTLSQMGEQGVADMKKVSEVEPENSILAKIYGFINPHKQAVGLLNLFKVFSPLSTLSPDIIKLEKDLNDKSKISQDDINFNIEKISYHIKQKLGENQKDFRKSFGFTNPVINQAYNIVDFFGKGKDVKTNDEYERAKLIVSKSDPNFNNLSKSQQFDKVQEAIQNFVELSKSNAVIVPMNKKELDFKNEQIANVSGTPSQKTQQLMNLGLTANGKFVDFYTGKETTIEDVMGETGQLKYMGQLDNSNQFGPAMSYFQGANGKFYVSPSSLDDRSNNYIDWALNQVDNKFSKRYEVPLEFDSFRDSRSFENDGTTVRNDISKLKIERNLNNNSLDVSVIIPDLKTNSNLTIKADGVRNTEEAKKAIAIQLIQKGYSANEVLKLGF